MPLTKIQSLGITDGTIVNADINASAGITSAKLDDLANPFGKELLHVRDEKTSGTQGGTFTSGSFVTRTLNTSVTNEISGASLSSNQITLPSGTYFVIADAPAYSCDTHRLKLRNITDSSDTLLGNLQRIADAVDGLTTAMLSGRFTISAQKTFELQHRCNTTENTYGLGIASGYSLTEIYANIMIWKVA